MELGAVGDTTAKDEVDEACLGNSNVCPLPKGDLGLVWALPTAARGLAAVVAVGSGGCCDAKSIVNRGTPLPKEERRSV